MSIVVVCPNKSCGKSYSVADSMRGQTIQCKNCQTRFDALPVETVATREEMTPATVVPPPASEPAQIGRYLVRATLGSGAFGKVYRAFDPQLDRNVALKVLRPEILDSPEAVERFQREAKAVAKLHHPAIVPVYDYGRDGDRHFIAYALIDGHSLSAAIEPGGMEPRRAARLVARLAEALAYAHDAGILHRDIKPANVMLDKQDQPLLVDFGLARSATAHSGTSLTRTGALLGTPGYMAPEQLGEKIPQGQHSSDLYSLGVTLYQLLTGTLPFRGELQAVLAQILFQNPLPLHTHRPGLDPRLEAICLKAMARNPKDRYANGRDFAAALTHWLESAATSSSATPLLPQPHQRRTRALFAVVLAPVLVVVLALVLACGVAGGLAYPRLVAKDVPPPPPSNSATWPALPQGPAPRVVFLPPEEMSYTVNRYKLRNVVVEETVRQGNLLVKQKRNRIFSVPEVVEIKVKPSDLHLTDTQGNPLDPRQVFTRSRMVLVSADGRPIDRFYLDCFRKDAPVVVDTPSDALPAQSLFLFPALAVLDTDGRLEIRYPVDSTILVPNGERAPEPPKKMPEPMKEIPPADKKEPEKKAEEEVALKIDEKKEDKKEDKKEPLAAPKDAPPDRDPPVGGGWTPKDVLLTSSFQVNPQEVLFFRGKGTPVAPEEWKSLLRKPTRVLLCHPDAWPLDESLRELLRDDVLVLVGPYPHWMHPASEPVVAPAAPKEGEKIEQKPEKE